RLTWLRRQRSPAALAAVAAAAHTDALRALTPLPFVTTELVTALDITADLADLAGRGLLEPVPGGDRVPDGYRVARPYRVGSQQAPAAAAAWYAARGRHADALRVA